MDNYSVPNKRSKPLPGGETEDEYRRVMQKIMEGMTKDNLEAAMFLCKDHIPQGRDVKTPMDFFRYLEDRDLVSQESVMFIAEVLHLIRRMDLLKVIPCVKNKRHFEDEFLTYTYENFSNYRILTIHLQDELSQSDFEKFRFQCASHLRNRSLEEAQNVLMLLRKLEEQDIISHDNFEELVTILKNVENARPLKMFQRLLDGDESVTMPPGKMQKQSNSQLEQQGAFADRRNVPIPAHASSFGRIPNPSGHHVERETSALEYGSQVHARAIVDGSYPTIPKSNTGSGKPPVMYNFREDGRTKWFESDESAPKIVGFDTPDHEYPQRQSSQNDQFYSMPYGPHSHRHFSNTTAEFNSMPPNYHASPPPQYSSYFQGFIPHSNTVPQDMQKLVHQDLPPYHSYQHEQQRYAPQHSSDVFQGMQQHQPAPWNSNLPMTRHMSYNNMPMQSPPGRSMTDVSRQMENLVVASNSASSTDSDAKCILEESIGSRNPPGKPMSHISEEMKGRMTTSGDDAGASNSTADVEHKRQLEVLRKKNEILQKIIQDQKGAGCYKMDSSPVGLCLLINNVHFVENFNHEEYKRRIKVNKSMPSSEKLLLPKLNATNRVGSDIDARMLENLFDMFDFKVERHDDVDQREMKKIFNEAASQDHSAYDCFFCIILSHGDNGCVYGVDSYSVKIADLQAMFFANECETLACKPKIFFIQACQGTRNMPSHTSPEADVEVDGPNPENGNDKSTPNKADFLLAYSTVPGYVSYRMRNEGTYFIQQIVETFKQYYESQDLLSMMIMVNDAISRYEKTQVPMPVPTLRKKVYFRKKEGWIENRMPVENTENPISEVIVEASVSLRGDPVLPINRETVSQQDTREQYE